MAITFPLDLPATNGTNDISDIEFTNLNAVSGTISPFTGIQQVQEFSRNQLLVRAVTRPMKKDDAMTWWGFFRSLRSGLGTFLLGDPHNTTSQGLAATYPGTPLVAGGSQTGTALVIDGAVASQTGWLLSGDWIQLGTGTSSRLYTVVQDCSSDGSGNVTIEIRPELRSSPADNAAVTVASTKGVFRLTEHPSIQVGDDHFYRITFSAMEVV